MELNEESKKYLVINTSKGLKVPDRMPYGARPASEIFQRHMAGTLTDVKKTVVRIDDVLTTGSSDDEHLDNLEKVFKALQESGATVNLKKCSFFSPEVEYIGFVINEHGISTNTEKIQALSEIP